MALTPKLEQLVQLTTTHFELLNRNKSLSPNDRKRLKVLFVESILGGERKAPSLNGNARNGHNASDFMTAKEVEAWLRIDVKTLYLYAKRKFIPHVRLQHNVRFRRADLQRWVDRYTYIPKPGKPARK